MKYYKLVRDRIPEIIAAKGQRAKFETLDAERYKQKLIEKLEEELGEFKRDQNSEELSDILEVVLALAQDLGLSSGELEAIRQKKQAQRGGFSKRILLLEVED
jgi:predicted house-cleaning noncanonical NTP pyrophosphatase (MazG superfamily)